jgi:hypothetical protein
MPTLTIDVQSIRAITFVHRATSTTHPVHINTNCNYPEILSYHRTRKENNYLMNCILYRGAPLAYTVNNTMDGFFGQRVELTYLPSTAMLRMLIKAGTVYGAFIAVISFLAIVSTATDLRLKEGTLRSKIHNTIELLAMVCVLYKAYTTPFKRILSTYKDYAPFSAYQARSQSNGKWMCAQQFEPSSGRFILVVLAPLDGVDTWCALRLTSHKATHKQIHHTHEYRPHTVETCVVKATRMVLRRRMREWPHLNATPTWHDMFAFPSKTTGLSTIAISTYNQQHHTLMHQRFVSVGLDGLVLPFHTFSSQREKNSLQKRSYYCALLSTKQLPDAVVQNVSVAYHRLRDSMQSAYVHCSELQRSVVKHMFYVPLMVSMDNDTDFFKRMDNCVWYSQDHVYQSLPQMKSVRHKHRKTKTKKSPEKRKMVLWLVIATSSNRINHSYHNTVQMFQMYDVNVYIAEVSNAISTHDVYHMLNNTAHLHNGMQYFSNQHKCTLMQQWNTQHLSKYKKYMQRATHTTRKRSSSELRQIARYYIRQKQLQQAKQPAIVTT